MAALLACGGALTHEAPRGVMSGVVPQAAIGKVNIASANIRRRPERTLVWETLSNGDSAYAEDTLFVPPGADAQLVFNDGTTLELSENSLVVLEASAQPRVHLSQGSVLARDVPRGLSIDTTSGVTKLSPQTRAGIALHEIGARVDVYAGEARANGAQLGAGDAQEITNGIANRAKPWSATLTSPERNQRLYVGATPPSLTLLFKAPAGAHLQIASSDDFAHPLRDDSATASGHAGFSAPAPGIYYWRIADMSGHALSETRRVTLIEDKPPEPLRPALHELVAALPSHMLAFAWTAAPGAERYRLELSTKPDFSTLIADKQVVTTVTYLDRDLPEATYYWRVRVDPSERPSAPYSLTLAFRLVNKPVLDAPKLLGSEVKVGH